MVCSCTAFLFVLFVFAIFTSCHEKNSDNGKLPSDPHKWVCQHSLNPSFQMEIDQWCEMPSPRKLVQFSGGRSIDILYYFVL